MLLLHRTASAPVGESLGVEATFYPYPRLAYKFFMLGSNVVMALNTGSSPNDIVYFTTFSFPPGSDLLVVRLPQQPPLDRFVHMYWSTVDNSKPSHFSFLLFEGV
jgi:hypothetical protein